MCAPCNQACAQGRECPARITPPRVRFVPDYGITAYRRMPWWRRALRAFWSWC